MGSGVTARLTNRGLRPRFFSLLAALAAGLAAVTGLPADEPAGISATLLARARARLERGEHAAALGSLTAYLSTRPGDGEARLLRAQVYAMQNRWELAGEDLRQVLKSDPANARAECGLGEIAYRQNRFGDAYEHYSGARQIQPGDSFAGYMMFICRLLQDQPDEAALLLERMEAGRKDPSWHFAHAAQAYRKGDTTRGDYLVAAAQRMWPAAETARYARPLADQGWRVGP